MSCRWWMKRDEGTNAVRVFVESEKDVEDQGLVTLITPGSTKGEINLETDGSKHITVAVKSFDNKHAGNLFDGSFKGVRDGEEFCSIWYKNRTVGRNENEDFSDEEGDSTSKEPVEDGNISNLSDLEENGSNTFDNSSLSFMDDNDSLVKKYSGTHLIPTANMLPPREGQTIRNIDAKYLKTLKERVITYPTAHVAPLLANVQLSSGQTFDPENLEAYQYEMIGGNHSREVFQMLIQDPIYRLQNSFHCRLAAVYVGLSDEEALSLGKQHNISAEIQLPSKFQDDARLTRRIFAEIKSPEEEKLMDFNEQMRCVFMKVFSIDQEVDKKARKRVMDSLSTVRLVARLSQRCWSKADEIFHLYENGKIKGQRKAKNVIGLPDCKKSNWQFLHGLSEDQQFDLLNKISNKSLTFAEADANAKDIKTEEKVIKSLEDSFETTRDELPSKLTTKDSIVRLAKEVKQTSRKRKPVTSADFKRVCESLLDDEASESKTKNKEKPSTSTPTRECSGCESKRKELKLARKRIAELTKEVEAMKKAKTFADSEDEA